MCATSVVDYSFPVLSSPPAGYPRQRAADAYAERPFAHEYEVRRQALLEHIQRNPAPGNLKAPYYELARLAAGGAPHRGVFEAALAYIDQRKDCADFVLHAVLRLLYQFGGSAALGEGLVQRARDTLLGFKYWPDEPGQDSMCTWTENHQILFAAGAYLAGQMCPDDVFANSGQTGRQKLEVHRPRIVRWLDLRFRTGFSEWLSHYYYDEDLAALASLVDFCHDDEIRQRAAMVLDLLLFDMALNSFRGTFGCTHGRSYEEGKKRAADEPTTDTAKLLFGVGRFSLEENLSAVCLALSERYRLPRVIYEIADDQDRAELVNRQRMGIRLAEAEGWGLGFDDFEDGMVYLSLEAYAHYRTINLTMRMFDAYGWWDNAFFAPLGARRGLIERARRLGLMSLVARLFERDVNRNTRECVNTYTYRTPDYMLSSAQDYRKGYGGDQQHVWQATLGPGAVCFTTHPGPRDNPSPNYWTGSGSLPRVAQVQNVAIVVYNVDTRPGLYLTNRQLFTHAWLPRDAFDEVLERDGWVFARRGDGYLALCSQHPYHWQTKPGEDQDREIIVPGKRNVWICELGRRAVDRSFSEFVERIAGAELGFGRLRVSYHSPSQGHLEFAWRGPLRQNGKVVPLGDYRRYDNPYCQADFPSEDITIRHGDHSLHLNCCNATREVSAFV
jgi:hypothetical protein